MPKFSSPEVVHLSNGIPVLFQHYDSLAAATYWWVQTGSADERPEEAGFAHFLEHMLFKDAAAKETGKASTGQMATAIESLGGDINAYTSFDQTVFHVTCASHHWERVVAEFTQMASPLRFLKEDFEREREVILEELRKNEDSPGRQLFQSLFETTFKKHPYGREVIGFVKTLKDANVKKLEAFYRRQYVSGNMGLILVGPLEDGTGARKKAILKSLEKNLGSKMWAKKKPTLHVRREEPAERKKMSISVRKFDVKAPSLAVSVRVPDLRHSDLPALDLIGGVLGMGEMSRLYQRLFYGESIVTDVSGGVYVPFDAGMLYVQAEMETLDQVSVITRGIFEEMDRLRKEGPTEEELDRVLVNAESERLYATQTADGMAGRLGFLKFIVNDLEFDRDYLDKLRDCDRRHLLEVAARYFDTRRLSWVLLVPKETKDEDIKKLTTQVEELAQEILTPLVGENLQKKSAQKKSLKKSQGVSSSIQPELLTLPSGLRVAYRENPMSHVLSIQAATLGGLRLELADPVDTAANDWGSSFMMSLTWDKGTPNWDARKIAATIEGSAASLEGFAGRNTVGLQVTGLSRDAAKLTALFGEVLIDPTFPDSEVEHSRRVAEESVRGIEDHSSHLCSKLFLETLYENHPYRHLTNGSLESLKTMSSEKLRAFHRRWVRPESLVLGISGNFKRHDLEKWLLEIDSQLSSHLRLGGHKQYVFPKVADESELKGPRWVEKTLGREQMHMIVAGLGMRLMDEERYAMRLLQTVLGGQSGRLFIELREKKSLAYSVAPMSFEGLERGYVGTYIASAPQKRDEAFKGIRTVLEKLAMKGPTENEMKRAKEYLLGRRAMDLQSDSSLSTHYSLKLVYGLNMDEDAHLPNILNKITGKDLQKVCEKYLVKPHMVTSVVG